MCGFLADVDEAGVRKVGQVVNAGVHAVEATDDDSATADVNRDVAAGADEVARGERADRVRSGLETTPEAAILTAASRPTHPALDVTTGERAVNALTAWDAVATQQALWNTSNCLSQRLRGELSDSDGSHPATA